MSLVIEKLVGVGALIVSPNETFLAIEELNAIRSSAKLSGMQSLPMETVEPGETHRQAISRLFKEEVASANSDAVFFLTGRLCAVQLTPNVWLHAYLFEAACEHKMKIGTAGDEVRQPKWLKISGVLSEPVGSMRFRPGVKEVLGDYMNYKNQNGKSQELVRHFNTSARIPEGVFDLLDLGVNQTKALCMAGLHQATS